jgi:hypothetical protein
MWVTVGDRTGILFSSELLWRAAPCRPHDVAVGDPDELQPGQVR